MDVQQLIARGGWELVDPQPRHRADPEKFWLPPAEQLAQLKPGCTAKVMFALADQADPVRDAQEPWSKDGAPNLVVSIERMWLGVERVEGDTLVGVLLNLPESTHTRLVPGARVRFQRSFVIDLNLAPKVDLKEELAAMALSGFPTLDEAEVLTPEDPRRAPSISPNQAEVCASAKVKPERPWTFARMLLGRSVQPEVFPIYGVRSRPDRGESDCGWSVWAGDPDMEAAAQQSGFDIVDVRELLGRHREAWHHLALPPGWAFVVGPDGYRDVYEAPEALEE